MGRAGLSFPGAFWLAHNVPDQDDVRAVMERFWWMQVRGTLPLI
jgi:hypothetical protein